MSAIVVLLLAGFMVENASSGNVVRLIGRSNTIFHGRVEVFYNGSWGTVCDDYWDLNDANVVCRQLGFEGAIAAPLSSAFGRGIGQIWMDKVNCAGNESSLAECDHRGWGTHSCSHSEDASVVCIPGVRLAGGVSYRDGLVQVYYNNTWAWMCADQWNKKDADMVCRIIGFGRSSTYVLQVSVKSQQLDERTWVSNFQCSDKETTFLSCLHGGWRKHSCANKRKASVTCERPKVRLVGRGSNIFHGRVEIYYDGVWGTVCDDYWDLNDANVVCRQLGFEGAIAAPLSSAFGRGIGQIWMDKVNCAGNESSLAECDHRGWGTHSCSHSEDASVVCIPGVRFVERTSDRGGLVQVYYNNTWAWICADQWKKKRC
ncbi:neurotrypsin-like [Oculina patagonica]